MLGDTIFAMSSGAGRAGVAVTRLSGPESRAALEALSAAVPPPRRAHLATIRDPSDGAAIDRGLVLWFPGPASFTGEDVVEFHLHGSRAVMRRFFGVLAGRPGLRPAQPGEFTRRAFVNGKLDLARVEGLAALIASDTEAQRRFAWRVAAGEQSQLYESWRRDLLRASALVEAMIDFSDEDDVPADTRGEAGRIVAELRAKIDEHLALGVRGERLADGLRVAIAGRPNAGKSTLLNALVGRDVAIVSDEPGTTRDLLEVRLDLGGWPVTLVDTAGLREASGSIEREGVRRARATIAGADLVLWLTPIDESAGVPEVDAARSWIVATKADLVGSGTDGRHRISAKTGEGLDDLLADLERFAADTMGDEDESPALARERHRAALADGSARLAEACALWQEAPHEVLAETLRGAARALGRVTGRVDVEDVLGEIFATFCIGK
jgi:tRNA modification GTPase